ncbi:OmpA family protein [Burkholderia stabilis]|uniref:OmpA family protein n=1 Tax=Burkholderia stabilis TaxID=95485 RepID=UPI0015922693|nr:OmpA family protein [Burkholderia stabilis]
MNISFTHVVRASSLGAFVLSLVACTTQSGPTYDIRAVQLAGQPASTYRVSCDGLLSSTNQCAAAAERFCKGSSFTRLESVDRLRFGAPMKDPREITFMCGKPQPKLQPQPEPLALPQPQPEPPAQPVPQPRQMLLQGNANFATDSSVLTPAARRTLEQFVSANQASTFRRVTVSGYTDSTGSLAHNQRLSEARARSVATYLRTSGLQAGQFVSEGMGPADPVASNETAEGRAQNRRVEIQVVPE